jgi:hypothetical protein
LVGGCGIGLNLFFDAIAKSLLTSFPGDAKHRATMCNCTSENLEIPGLVLRTIPE